MKAVIKLDVPDFQIGQPVTVYFKDTMVKRGKCELDVKENGIKPCPFCGKEDTLQIDTVKGIEECRAGNFCSEDCPAYVYENDDLCPYHVIVCACFKGGCGASSGYRLSVEEAIKAWNRRGGEDA